MRSVLGTRPPGSFHFQHFGNAEGLAYNQVTSLYQDPRGLLWIGTWDGLCSYDGYDFSCLNRRPGESNSMPNNEVKCMLVDQQKYLWVGFRGGLYRYENGAEFTRIPKKERHSIRQMAFCGEHIIIAVLRSNFFHSRKILKVDTRSLTAEVFQVSDEKKSGLTSLLPEGDVVWLGSTQGVSRFNHVRGEMLPMETEVEKCLKNKLIWTICRARNGGLYFGTTNEIFYRPPGRDTLLTLPRLETSDGQAANPVCMLSDRSGALWVGTQTGLFYKPAEATVWQQLRHDPADPYSLSDNQVTCLLEDRSGVLWVGTRNGGLNKLNLAPQPFRNYRSSFFELDDFVKVFAFAPQSDSTMWIGTTHGLFLFDRRAHRLQGPYEIPVEGLGELGWNAEEKRDHWSEANTIMAICQTRAGRVMVGTRWIGLYEFDPGTAKFTRRDLAPNCSYQGLTIRHLHEDASGKLWVISERHRTLNLENWQCEADSALLTGLPSDYLWNLHQAGPDEYWLGSQQGWMRWNQATKQVMTLPMAQIRPRQANRTEDWAIFCFAPAQHGLWMGTYGSGLIHLDTASLKETVYTMADGLANNHVYGILKDGEGQLWMSTNRGISRFDPENKSFRNFSTNEELLIQEFESNSYFQCADGEMFFGGKNGFVSFYPGEFEEKTYRTRPRITSFKVFGKELITDSLIVDKRHLRLDATQNFFEIGFSSLDFGNPADTRYQYMLEPFDPGWISLQGAHRTRYTDLPPGNYMFKLKAANSDGKFNGEVLQVGIAVIPELHQQTWFRILLVTLGGGLVGGIVWQRVRLVRERDRRRASLATSRLEQETLRASVNNHFTANALNSIQSFIARNDKTKAMGYVAKFGRLIRLSLENSGSQFHTLAEEIEALKLYLELERLRAGNRFEVTIQVPPSLDTSAVAVPAMLIQPFLENAIWHGLQPLPQGGHLELQIRLVGRELRISVVDNGVGRAQARENKARSAFNYRSQGLQLVQERLEMLNVSIPGKYHYSITDLRDEAGRGTGTRVEICMPVQPPN